MPKNMKIDPKIFLNGSSINVGVVPSFIYKKSLKEELVQNLKVNDCYEILFQLKFIRHFESFLENWKITGQVNGKYYDFNGPAHISIGQEAWAVGQYFDCTIDDLYFGTHRNHSEVLAKCLSAIKNTDDDSLEQIMKNYFNIDLYNVIKDRTFKNVKEKSTYYIVYGLLAEILGKQQGVNKGLGGSMHMFFTPFGVYPNNAVVGGSMALALGSAMYKLQHKKKGIVISNIGDGGVSTGPFWETLHMASMDQYKTIWEKPYNKYPPLMINISNNGYAMGGQTKGETMGYSEVARIGCAFKPNNLFAERVNGNNVLAVIDLMKRKRNILIEGDGPVLNEIVTYRISGHSTGDSEKYRTTDEKKLWNDYDPIQLFINELKNADVFDQDIVDQMDNDISKIIDEVFNWCVDKQISNDIDFENDENVLESYMFSNEMYQNKDISESKMIGSYNDNEHILRLDNKQRYGFDSENKLYSSVRRYQLRDGIFEAVLSKMYNNNSLIVFGEEHRYWEGAYAVYRDLTNSTPPNRFFNTPIAEAAIVGSAIGYAICGGQAIVELMYFDFFWRAGDEVANQMAKWRAMSGGQLKIPVVLRTNIGFGYGAQHSSDLTAVAAHLPGIKIVNPVTPYDAKGLMISALNQSDPVLFIEVQQLYDIGEQFVKTGVPKDEYEVKFGEPIIRQKGQDLTIITLGQQLYVAFDAIEEFNKRNISVELIDLRSIVPLNYEILVNSIKKTGKVILANNGLERNNIMKEISSNLTRLCFDYLDAPPLVLGSKNWIMPSETKVKYIYPSVDDYLNIYSQNIVKLDDIKVNKNHSDMELMRRKTSGM